MNIIDLTGRRFGAWLVLAFASRENRSTLFRCRCDCGVEKNVRSLSLLRRSRPSRSCGCVRPTPVGSLRHGAACRGRKTREYRIWKNMRTRCLNPRNPSFSRYGAAGITICDRWSDYAAFLADMGRAPTPLHTLDRRDNAKGYSPENCRWATQTEQQRNRTNNKLDAAKADEIRNRRRSGEPQHAVAAAFGVSRQLVRAIERGTAWSVEATP